MVHLLGSQLSTVLPQYVSRSLRSLTDKFLVMFFFPLPEITWSLGMYEVNII